MTNLLNRVEELDTVMVEMLETFERLNSRLIALEIAVGLQPTQPELHKEAQPNQRKKLTPDNVREIRKLIAQGASDSDIAVQYKVRPGTIWYIRYNKTHRKVK